MRADGDTVLDGGRPDLIETRSDFKFQIRVDRIGNQQSPSFQHPDYLRDVNPDEERFADMTRTVFFVTSEETVLDNT